MPEWAVVVLGAMGLGLAGTLFWGSKQSAKVQGLTRELSDTEAASAHLEKTLRQVEAERSEQAARVEALQAALEDRGQALDRAQSERDQARSAAAETALLIQDHEAALESLRGELSAQQTQARNTNRAFADLRAHARRQTELLNALGADAHQENTDAFSPAMRPVTRQAMQQLLVDCGAQATALGDSQGLLGAAAGAETGAVRLGIAAGLATELQAELEAVLCGAIDGWSIMDRRFCTHLMRLDARWWLGVENQGTAPLFAMRQCRLKLVGIPQAPPSVLGIPSTTLSLDERPDEKLSEKVSSWAARWSAQSVTVLDVEGRPFGASASAQPSTVMALGRKLRPLLTRMDRDGRFLDELSLVARAKDGTTAMLRVAGQGLESPIVAAVARTELPEEALDELCGLIRWHAPSAPTLAAV